MDGGAGSTFGIASRSSFTDGCAGSMDDALEADVRIPPRCTSCLRPRPRPRPCPPSPRRLADPGEASASAVELARSLSLSITAADVLHRRGFDAGDTTRRFLDPKLSHLTPPDAMADRDASAARLARAIKARERICVFGDYDCDGITATAIMTGILRRLGAEVVPLLATRLEGAYGLSARALARVFATGATLLVTCDCGSSDHPRLADVKARGIDAIVIDHHLVPAEPLPVIAFLNPQPPECGFPYKGMASCGSRSRWAPPIRRALDVDLDIRPFLDLVAIGTIADVAPLDGDNRALVRAGLGVLAGGLSGLSGGRPRPGLRAPRRDRKIDSRPRRPRRGRRLPHRAAPQRAWQARRSRSLARAPPRREPRDGDRHRCARGAARDAAPRHPGPRCSRRPSPRSRRTAGGARRAS